MDSFPIGEERFFRLVNFTRLVDNIWIQDKISDVRNTATIQIDCPCCSVSLPIIRALQTTNRNLAKFTIKILKTIMNLMHSPIISVTLNEIY